MGNVISKAYDLIAKVKPDAVLILGDTNSALSAISAKRLRPRFSIWKRAIVAGIGMSPK
jgi:UDP-N-acetylglucosamine 2-epimerase